MGIGKRSNKISPKDPKVTVTNQLYSPPLSSGSHSNSPFNQKGLNPNILKKAPLPDAKTPVQTDPEKLHDIPLFVLLTTYFSYSLLVFVGHVRDFFGKIFKSSEYTPYAHRNGYAPIVDGFDSMFHRRLYMRIRDCFSRPTTGVASRTVKVLERKSDDYNKTYTYTGKSIECLNLASYNYLGFSEKEGVCADQVIECVKQNGITSNTTRNEVGLCQFLLETEKMLASFVGKEDAIIQSQGFSTNSTTIPILVGKGSLIISDELNHCSIVTGARLSGANIRTFKHNDVVDLEATLRFSISQGQPRTHRPWKKILLIIEGIYSMEGSIPILQEIIQLKQKYKFYIYLDEAHSIGALGPRGRGTCDYLGVDPAHIDVMMGTFTKSFGAAGGYIAGSKELIDKVRITNHNSIYAEPMQIPVLQQVNSSMRVIMGLQGGDLGQRKLEQLAFNSRYFFSELKAMGFTVTGNGDSPVIPLMLFHPSKIAAFSRECLNRGLAVVVVTYPATPLITGRVRFCLSASHTKEDLDKALAIVSDVGDRLLLKNMF
ncbi:PLP-dependent transferase [Neoconidiobolus thromboides FSU 785]|nr:PLP-dependent transferase [Neoconidiobolus thromboides FSU 785]